MIDIIEKRPSKLTQRLYLVITVAIALPIFIVAIFILINKVFYVSNQNFTSPSGNRVLKIKDDCSFLRKCRIRVLLAYQYDGNWREMNCPDIIDSKERFVFNKGLKLKWQDAENTVSWQTITNHSEQIQARTGKINFLEDCAHTGGATVFRGLKRTGLSFRENCLGESCRRSLMLELTTREKDGRFTYSHSCQIDQSGSDLMLSDGNYGSVMTAQWGPDRKIIYWRGEGVKWRTGTIEIARDCNQNSEQKRLAYP